MRIKASKSGILGAIGLLLSVQLLIFVAFYCFLNAEAAVSMLAGGAASTLGQIYFLIKMDESRGPGPLKQSLRYFYRAEFIKLALIISILALILVLALEWRLFSLNLGLVFLSFVVAQCISSFVPWCIFFHSGKL